VRGAQNEPRPAGERPYPNNTTSAVPPRSSGAGAAPASAASSSASGLDSVMLGDYDPATGNVITADGNRLRIGTSAGAEHLFGGSSWQLLLLGPLAP
jgi:hypothetical protein